MTTEPNAPAFFAPSVRMHHATRTKATALAMTLVTEYPRLILMAIEGDEIDHETYTHDGAGFRVVVEGDEGDVIYEGDKVPSLAEVLDECAENGIDPTGDEDETPRTSGSVVPEKYRENYRLISSTGRSNGDWLAERLAADCLNSKGDLIVDDFVAILEKNGVDMSGKWSQMRFTQTRGWQGRFRMNGRQVLEKIVTKSGVYFDHTGVAVEADADWLADMRSKHSAWLGKEAKREAAAEAAIKQAVEGAEAA